MNSDPPVPRVWQQEAEAEAAEAVNGVRVVHDLPPDLFGPVKTRAQRTGLIQNAKRPGDIAAARHANIHNPPRDLPAPVTPAESRARAKAEAKRLRKAEHHRGPVTVIEATE